MKELGGFSRRWGSGKAGHLSWFLVVFPAVVGRRYGALRGGPAAEARRRTCEAAGKSAGRGRALPYLSGEGCAVLAGALLTIFANFCHNGGGGVKPWQP